MSIEIIIAIAEICRASGTNYNYPGDSASSYRTNRDAQLACQAELLECYEYQIGAVSAARELKRCILLMNKEKNGVRK